MGPGWALALCRGYTCKDVRMAGHGLRGAQHGRRRRRQTGRARRGSRQRGVALLPPCATLRGRPRDGELRRRLADLCPAVSRYLSGATAGQARGLMLRPRTPSTLTFLAPPHPADSRSPALARGCPREASLGGAPGAAPGASHAAARQALPLRKSRCSDERNGKKEERQRQD